MVLVRPAQLARSSRHLWIFGQRRLCREPKRRERLTSVVVVIVTVSSTIVCPLIWASTIVSVTSTSAGSFSVGATSTHSPPSGWLSASASASASASSSVMMKRISPEGPALGGIPLTGVSSERNTGGTSVGFSWGDGGCKNWSWISLMRETTRNANELYDSAFVQGAYKVCPDARPRQ